MKIQLFALVALFAAASNAAETTTTNNIRPTAIIPIPPPGVICPMSVCPAISSLSKRKDPACPASCADDCKIIDDICCPGIKKAICSSSSSSIPATAITSGSGAVSSAASSTASSTASITVPTSLVAPNPVASTSTSVSPAAASTSASGANTYTAVLSSCMLVTLISIGLNQL